MEEQLSNSIEAISQEDWEPASVKRLVEEIAKRARQLEEQLRELQAEHQLLQEQVNRTSANSSQPPSQDPPGFKPFERQEMGQPGHKGRRRFYPRRKAALCM